MTFKTLAIDLDGTLLIGESLPEGHRKAVAAASEAGFNVIIATARWRQMAGRIAAEIGIIAPIIACSGAQVYLPDEDRDIFDHRLPEDFVSEFFTLCDAHRCIATVTFDDGSLLSLEGEPDPSVLSEELVWVPALTGQKGRPRIATVQGSGAVKAVRDELEPRFAGQVTIHDSIGPSGKIVLTITNKLANKGEALKATCKHLGIDPGSVVAFGDAENDIEMFKIAGASVAMGQASDKVKQAAHHVTSANTENGVGLVIDRLLSTGEI